MIFRTPEEQKAYEYDREMMYARAKGKALDWYEKRKPVYVGIRWPEWYFNGNYKRIEGIEPEKEKVNESELF